MKPVLILLTESFPYGINAEAFLEAEIEIAADYFDEIYIFPSARGINENEKRNIQAQNVHSVIVKRNPIIIEFARGIAYILKHRGFWQDVRLFCQNGLFFKIAAWRKLIYAILTEAAITRHFLKDKIIIRNDTPLIIYSYWLFGEAGGAIAISGLYKSKSIIISRGHGTDIVGHMSLKNYSPLLKFYMDNHDVIYPVSEKGKEILLGQYRKYESPSLRVYKKLNPIHLGIENQGLKTSTWGKRDGVFTILSCSSVIPVKRVDLIVEALSKIKSRKIRWIHLGSGVHLNDLKKKCAEKLGKNIEYKLMGGMSRSSVIEFYKENYIHLFLNVSSSEGIPVSVMEAFDFGIPAVATNVGGTSELVCDGVNGFLLPVNFKVDDLGKLIERVIDISETRNDEYQLMRDEARKIIVQEFSIQNYRHFYNDVIKMSC